MVFTSYYSSRLIRGKESQCVGISRKRMVNFRHCSKLEPPKEMFAEYQQAKATGNKTVIQKAFKRYEVKYKNYLLTLDVHAAYQALDGRILLCFEKDDTTCHRKWIRDWFKHFGYEAAELTAGDRSNVYAEETIDIGAVESSTKAVAGSDTLGRKKMTWQDLKEYMWYTFFVEPFDR